MKFSVQTTSGSPTADLSFTIEIPDEAARQYTTVVNAGIAAVVARAGGLLIDAEDDHNLAAFLTKGNELVAAISKF